MAPANFRVIVLGGGNCGCAIATGLKKAGIDYVVHERDNEDRYFNGPRDWGMLLHWGAEYLEELLPEHMQPRMKEIRCDPLLADADIAGKKAPYVNAVTGEIIAELPMAGVNRISRMKLRRFLTGGTDQTEKLNIQFNKYVESVSIVDEDTVKVTFRDGTSDTANMIVGADGAHSKVRQFLVGEEDARCERIGLTMVNLPISGYSAEEVQRLQSLHPVFKIGNHSERHGAAVLAALDIHNSDDPKTWRFQNYIGWWGPPYAEDLQDHDARRDFYRDFTSAMCDPFRTGASGLRDEDPVPVYPGQQWAPTMPWDNHGGKFTLAGDAAHSMLPQRGQGLNHAIQDAHSIVGAIKAIVAGKKEQKDAITEYEEEMKPRGATEVRLSLEQALTARDDTTIKESPIFKLGWMRSHPQHGDAVPQIEGSMSASQVVEGTA